MTKIIKCVGVIALPLVMACSTMVTPTDSGPYAPKNGAREGTVAYNPAGIKEIVSMRRNDALKAIFNTCGSNNYQIVKDEDRARDPKSPDTIATFGTKTLHYISFKCN